MTVRRGEVIAMKTLIGVIGGSVIEDAAVADAASEVGREIIRHGYALICGGLGGVMEAACRGAYEAAGEDSGRIIGVLPGYEKGAANRYVDVVITTGMGYARNAIIAASADAVIAVSGGSGTLSEIAYAWQFGKPVVAISSLPGISSDLIGSSLDDRRNDAVHGASDAGEALSLLSSLLHD
jgi:uncharacterized protein (TIGR00725 family)